MSACVCDGGERYDDEYPDAPTRTTCHGLILGPVHQSVEVHDGTESWVAPSAEKRPVRFVADDGVAEPARAGAPLLFVCESPSSSSTSQRTGNQQKPVCRDEGVRQHRERDRVAVVPSPSMRSDHHQRMHFLVTTVSVVARLTSVHTSSWPLAAPTATPPIAARAGAASTTMPSAKDPPCR